MKKILFSILLILELILTGCDNNDGPFEFTFRNGAEILLSDEKPAKGNVQFTINGTVAWEAYFDEGQVDGELISYNHKNVEVYKGTFKRLSDNKYGVDIVFADGGTIKGTMNTTSEEILDLAGEASVNQWDSIQLDNWFDRVGIDAVIDNSRIKATKKNGVFDGNWIKGNTSRIYKNGKITKEVIINGENFTDTDYKDDKIVKYMKKDYSGTETFELLDDLTKKTIKYANNGEMIFFELEKPEIIGSIYYSKNPYGIIYHRIIAPEDKANIEYQNRNIDYKNSFYAVRIAFDETAYDNELTIEAGERNHLDEYRRGIILEEWKMTKNNTLINNIDQCEDLYYEVIGSNLNKNSGVFNKLISDPSIKDVYYSPKHKVDSNYPRIK